jgi:beta-lactamase class D
VAFLRRLYRGNLPFDRGNIEIVKSVLVQEEKDGVVFSGKTGSGDAGNDQYVGWFVGRQASPPGEYIFATRIVAPDRGRPRGEGADGLHARATSRAMLSALPAR